MTHDPRSSVPCRRSSPPRHALPWEAATLFRIERTLAGSPRKKKEKIRDKRSRHVVDAFFSWCDLEADKVLDDTPIAKGIRYAHNQRVGLSRFLQDGRLPIHNNMSELELRREAVGRKIGYLSPSFALPRQHRTEYAPSTVLAFAQGLGWLLRLLPRKRWQRATRTGLRPAAPEESPA